MIIDVLDGMEVAPPATLRQVCYHRHVIERVTGDDLAVGVLAVVVLELDTDVPSGSSSKSKPVAIGVGMVIPLLTVPRTWPPSSGFALPAAAPDFRRRG